MPPLDEQVLEVHAVLPIGSGATSEPGATAFAFGGAMGRSLEALLIESLFLLLDGQEHAPSKVGPGHQVEEDHLRM